MTTTISRFIIPKPKDVPLGFLPSRLQQKLLPFQKEGINYAISREGRCLIADEMGLGKTLQAIATAYYYKDEWPLLILLPASLKYQWVEELEKWLPGLLPSDINIINSSSDVGNITNCCINLVSYSLLRFGNPEKSVLLKSIRAQKFQIVICDESHSIRNKKTRTANIVIDLVTNSRRCLMLSGTPALNKPSELYTQIDALGPGRFGSFNDYAKRYCDAKYKFFGRSKVWSTDGAKNLDELEYKLKQHLMIRRLKREVLTQLPPKRRQKVPFDLKFGSDTADLQKELTAMQDELEHLIQTSGASVAQAILPGETTPQNKGALTEIRKLISQLYTKTCQAKVGPVVEFVTFYTTSEECKVLIFAHHHNMMNSIQEALWKDNIKHIRIDGSVNSAERNNLVKQFQNDPKTRVAILSILAAGMGLTLTAASIVVFAELYWTPAILQQCEDRAHRIGQTANSVNIYYLVARGTIDERVWSLVERKTRVLSMALDGRKSGLKAQQTSRHVSDILSTVSVRMPSEPGEENGLQVDVDVEDFFRLEDLKKANQCQIDEYISQMSKSARRKSDGRPTKRLVLRPVEVVDLLNSDEEAGSPGTKRAKFSDDDFMNWAMTDKPDKKDDSDSKSLPSLTGSPPGAIVESESSSPDRPESPGQPISPLPDMLKLENDEPSTSTVPEETKVRERKVNTKLFSSPQSGQPEFPTALQTKTEVDGYSNQAKSENLLKSEYLTKSENLTKSEYLAKSEPMLVIDTPSKFSILPVKRSDSRNSTDSNVSLDLFSDDSSAGEGDSKSPEFIKATPDPEAEAQIAISLMDDSDEEPVHWTCFCGVSNPLDFEICKDCALPQAPLTWMCQSCGGMNKQKAMQCDDCFEPRQKPTDKQEEERSVDLSKIPVQEKFYFLISQHTGRVFLHDSEKNYLSASFHILDLENEDLLPDVLLKEENIRLAKAFAESWSKLKKREQKSLIKKGELFTCPEKAYFGGRLTKLKPIAQRYRTKADVAAAAEGEVTKNPGARTRHIVGEHLKRASGQDEMEPSRHGYIQVMSSDNHPMCITCQKPLESDLLSVSTLADECHAWETRFCSPKCADQHWMKSNTTYLRDRTRELDKGVCEHCGVDASEIYQRVKRCKSLKQRAKLIQESRFASLAQTSRVTMCKDPVEGQFWQADHILPVYAGGGQADIDNLRTLCTPCHHAVTAAQTGHRARMKRAVGSLAITDFFSPGTNAKLSSYKDVASSTPDELKKCQTAESQ